MTLTDACAFSVASDTWANSTGKIRDAETENDYFGARYYASGMGRFMSPDFSDYDDPDPVPYAELENPQTLNIYSYVYNNPLRNRDDDGHAGWGPCANDANGQCWNGNYNGERDCSGSGGCLFWNGSTNQWEPNDPSPPSNPGDLWAPVGIFFGGFFRAAIADNLGDFTYGLNQMGCGAMGGRGSGCTTHGIPDTAGIGAIRAKKPNMSGKDASTDIPSWAKGSGPQGTENGKEYAKRMMNGKYGEGNWETSDKEYSQLKKYGDRAFVPAEEPVAKPAIPDEPVGPVE